MSSIKTRWQAAAGAAFVAVLSIAHAQSPVATTSSGIAWSSSDTRTDLMSKVSTFFSTAQGDFVNKSAMEAKASNVSEQFNYVLGGIPDPETILASGRILFGACEPHNCVGSKVFVVTDTSGEVVQAAGFLGPKCGPSRQADPGQQLSPGCDDVPTLTIFYAGNQARKPELSLEIVEWARQKISDSGRFKTVKTEERFIH